ncbi:GNAT family N-acetyltransferase [Paenibacillus nasutitermitis]|uniref:N-acetyltransferase domain-containing protein n=1 Tax=Paenibacillus nasutitermitis TaxID=1652958 RepID=A0A916YJ46_9BACL|nr:GNAT family N-acetyltransferase [Paenibacillus nasutitermitis]GGD48239.1 hypothetical protein GCM10010911_02140 [Paenibacillus nasutitermitis]
MIRPRRARTDDTEIIRLIKSELMPLSFSTSPRDAQTIRELPIRLRSGTTFVVSRTKTSTPLGFVHLYTQGGTLLYDMLAVHPQHRGKKLGTKLMAYGEAYARKQECTTARLFVDYSNNDAQRLYTRLGFRANRDFPELRCFEMVKSLT